MKSRKILERTVAAVFRAPVEAMKDGRNYLVFRNEEEAVTLPGLAVRTNRFLL